MAGLNCSGTPLLHHMARFPFSAAERNLPDPKSKIEQNLVRRCVILNAAEDDLDDSRNIGRPGALRFPVVETGVDEFNPSSFAQSHTFRIPFPSIRWVPCNT